jgi:hypothetical protein
VKAANRKPKSAALLGMAFDAADGHTRLTRGENFFLVGGSEQTHAVMQETAVKINENLDRRGKRLEDVSVGELREICHEVRSSLGDNSHPAGDDA